MFSYVTVFSLRFHSEPLSVTFQHHLNLQNAPTQSLLSVVNGILDESIERKSYEMPHVCNSRIYWNKIMYIEYVSVSMYLCNCSACVHAWLTTPFIHSAWLVC